MRRVSWPRPAHPGRTVTCNWYHNLWGTEIQCCLCPEPSEDYFATCVNILAMSSRLRRHIREVELTSQRRLRYMVSDRGIAPEILHISTIAAIMDLLPDLKSMFLRRCALRFEAPPSGGALSNSSSFDTKKLYTIREPRYTFGKLIYKTDIQAMFDLLSFFQKIGKFTLGSVPNWGSNWIFSFPRPLPSLKIHTLMLQTERAGKLPNLLCRELRAHADLTGFHEMVVDYLTPDLLDFVCAAPSVETVTCNGVHIPYPTDDTERYRGGHIRAMILKVSFSNSGGCQLSRVAANLHMISILNISELVLAFHFHIRAHNVHDTDFGILPGRVPMAPYGNDVSQMSAHDMDVLVLKAVIARDVDWPAISDALKRFTSLRALTFQVHLRSDHKDGTTDLEQDASDLASAMEAAAAALPLPPKYADMLRIVAMPRR